MNRILLILCCTWLCLYNTQAILADTPRLTATAVNSHTITLITLPADGSPANGDSDSPSLSADGEQVVYVSRNSNLLSQDTSRCDLQGVTVSCSDILLYNRQTQTTHWISVNSRGQAGNHDSLSPMISADGQWVAYLSHADNLVVADNNQATDIFLHHLQAGSTRRVSVGNDGTEANDRSYNPFISADGRYIAFTSHADNLVFGDTNGVADVFRHDQQTGETQRISLTPTGGQSHQNSWGLSISGDGQRILFAAGGALDDPLNQQGGLYLFDGSEYTVRQILTDTSGFGIFAGHLSADGNHVIYQQFRGHWTLFQLELTTGLTRTVSLNNNGIVANFDSFSPLISADGGRAIFSSRASNLVDTPVTHVENIYLHDSTQGRTTLLSQNDVGQAGDGKSELPALSADGQWVAYASYADNLTNHITDTYQHIYLQPVSLDTPSTAISSDPLSALDFAVYTASLGFPINDAAISPDETTVALAGAGGVGFYDLPDLTLQQFLYIGPVADVTWSPDSDYIATAGYDGAVPVWYAWTGGKVNLLGLKIKPEDQDVDWDPRADWSPDGAFVATNSIDENLYLWRVLSATAEIILNDDGAGQIDAIDWSPDGQTIAVSDAQAVRIWQVADGRTRTIMPQANYQITDLRWSPEGDYLAFSSTYQPDNNYWVHLWHPQHGTAVLPGHTAPVNRVAWSPTNLLASAGEDGVRLWDTQTTQSRPLLGTTFVTGLDWSPSGQYLIAATEDGEIYLWQP